MATSWSGWLAVCVIFTSRIYHSHAMKTFPSPTRVKEWSMNLSDFWLNHASTLTGFDTIQPAYAQQWNPSSNANDIDVNVDFKKLNSTKLVEDMSSSLSEMLTRKMIALQRSVEKAEREAANYTWDPTLTREDVKCINANDMMGVPLSYNERFGQNVSFNFSSVHIPVEIYAGDLEILNGLNWTSKLDKVFQENYEKDPEILWQYFGSQAGFMRFLPASAWKKHGEVDLYDVRRQSWYTQGSSSPKDMMILIDTSGSTHGQALQLMKVAVKSILDTLGENDFVNIAEFSSEANFVSSCFNHTPFVQANYRNKQKLSNDVNRLKANGMANFKAGLTFAFEQFERFQRNETDPDPSQRFGANCNKVIMMLTDGGTDNAEEVFKQYNWPNKTVRVFTYAVGPTANPTNAIRWMACANRGYFSQIPAMGAIRTRVQRYVNVLARPLAIEHIEHAQWSSSHSSPFVDFTDEPGLGMMTTVTLPVYNRTAGSSNQTILGVMGIDVTTADLVKKSPQRKLGPNGYAYAINHNGYIIFHPNLNITEYLKDPPNVDFFEIEIPNEEKNTLRTAMIKGETGFKDIETFVISGDRNYVYRSKLRYSYEPIVNTSFSLGISVPSYQSYYPEFRQNIDKFDLKYLNPESISGWDVLIAPWNFYENMTRTANLTGRVQDILDLLANNTNPVNWDFPLLSHLYWDAKLVSSVDDYFVLVKENYVVKLKNGTEYSDTTDHVLTFISTDGGFTRVFPKTQSSVFENHRDPYKEAYYKRVLASENYVFFIEPFSKAEQGANGTDVAPDITVGRAVSIRNGPKGEVVYKPAVVGARFKNTKFVDSLFNRASSTDSHDCSDPDSLICYLVDEGGFLIASNQEELLLEVGSFLGKLDPPVMDMLLNKSVYDRIKHYDYQASHVCKAGGEKTSAGYPSLRVPSINLLFDMLSFNWWTTKLTWLYLNFNLWNSWFSSQDVYAQEDEEPYEVESCVGAVYFYYFGKTNYTTETLMVDCANCTRNISASRLDYTNLLLVVADPTCEECKQMFSPLPQEAVQVSEDEEKEVICDLAREPRYRKVIEECYSEDDREDASKCGCMSTYGPSVPHVLISLAVILFSVHVLATNS